MAASARNSTESQHTQTERPALISSPHSLSRAVHARKLEYVRPRKIKIKVGSWNVAACPGTDKDLAGWFMEGKGIDKRLAGLTSAIQGNHSQDNVESVSDQEARRTKKESTIPKGDQGVIAGGDEIGLYVLGLQEVVELTAAKEYIGRVYSDSGPTTKWRNALKAALPPGYQMICEQQLSGLLLYIFASPEVAPTISSVSSVSVGTGIMGYLGNKGAVTTRIVLGDTTRLVFVNSHLASGTAPSHLDRRCWDVDQIIQRTHFDHINWGGVLEDSNEGIGDEDFAFWFGDLNFRLDGLPGDDIRRILMLHTKGEYDLGQKNRNKMENEIGDDESPIIIHSVDSDDDECDIDTSNSGTHDNNDDTSSSSLPDPDDFIQDPSQDPASLQATLDSLLPHDQLRHVQKSKRAFHDGWREGPITFLPTYKYDVGSMGMFDSSEKKRSPSWCDRILFRTRRDKLEYDGKSQEEALAKLKDEEMKSRGIEQAGDDENVLFDYDPEDDGDDTMEALPTPEPLMTGKDFYDDYDEGEDAHPGAVITKEGFLDRISLEVYTSHQRVLSSDHKPLDAVFTLEYDAVIPELKSKVQQEVARELDRAENEGRPGITVVIDRSQEIEDVRTSGIPHEESLSAAEGINFGPVSYRKRISRGLTIANTSQVTSTFAFVERPSESGEGDQIAPSWLTVSFVDSGDEEGTRNLKEMNREVKLEPGDAVNCTLEVFVDDVSLVRSLNENKLYLDDVLVLRVTDGRDHFVPIRGTWLQSCFARSIEELIHIPEGGVRALSPRPKGQAGGPVNRGAPVCWSAPRELFKITEAVEDLTRRVLADAGILPASQIPKDAIGWPFEPKSWLLQDIKARESKKSYVLEAMDSDKPLIESFPPEIPAIERLEIVAEVLISWLGSLTDGIVTEELWAKLDADITARGAKQLTDAEETKDWILDVLSASPNHNIAFVFLTSMLYRVANDLAPLPKEKSARHSMGHKATSSFGSVRRSLSWRSQPPPEIDQFEAVVERRRATEKAYASTFAEVVFRGPTTLKDKERKVMDERRRYVLECFLHGSQGK